MPRDVLQREPWTGRSIQLGDLFLMRKEDLEARCELWTHPEGWECRLFAGEEQMIASQVCRDQEDVYTFSDRWTAALEQKGWSIR